MLFPWAEAILIAAAVYGAAGGVVAAAFLFFGLDTFDAGARASYAFRALIAPGLVLLWPLVLWRWATGLPKDAGPRRVAHAFAWMCLAVVVPALLAIGFAQRDKPVPASTSIRLPATDARP